MREELGDRFGPIPEPLDNLVRLQDARFNGVHAASRVDVR